MNTAQVTNRTVPLVKYLRAHGHAKTPIVLAEGTPTPADWLNSSVNGHWGNEKNAALRTQYEALLAGGEDPALLHYVEADDLFRCVLFFFFQASVSAITSVSCRRSSSCSCCVELPLPWPVLDRTAAEPALL